MRAQIVNSAGGGRSLQAAGIGSQRSRRPVAATLSIVAISMVASTAQLKQLPPFSFVPGNLTTLLLGLALVLAVASVATSGTMPRLVPAVFATLIFVLMAMGMLKSPGTEYANFKVSRLALATMPTVAVVALVVRDRRDVRLFMGGLIGSALYASLMLRLTASNLNASGVSGRLVSEGGATISFGRSAAFVIAALLVWFFASRSIVPLRAAAAILIIGLELWIMLSVGSRGPIQALLLAAATTVSFALLRSEGQRWGRWLAVGLLASFAAGIAWSAAPEVSRSRILLLGSGTSSGARRIFIDRTLEIGDLSPIGHGWGSWPEAADLGGTFTYPHNAFLEIWFEAGVIGLLLFSGLLAYALVLQYRRRSTNPLLSSLLASSLVFWLSASLVSGDVNDNRALFALLVAAVVPVREPGDSSTAPLEVRS